MVMCMLNDGGGSDESEEDEDYVGDSEMHGFLTSGSGSESESESEKEEDEQPNKKAKVEEKNLVKNKTSTK